MVSYVESISYNATMFHEGSAKKEQATDINPSYSMQSIAKIPIKRLILFLKITDTS